MPKGVTAFPLRVIYKHKDTRLTACINCLRDRHFIPFPLTEHEVFINERWMRLLRSPSYPLTRICCYCGEEYEVA